MSQGKRWTDDQKFEVEQVFEEQQSHRSDGEISSEVIKEEKCSVISQLAVGQSLVVSWEDDETYLEFEEVIVCTSCGIALTDVRLAFSEITDWSCPSCGQIPEA